MICFFPTESQQQEGDAIQLTDRKTFAFEPQTPNYPQNKEKISDKLLPIILLLVSYEALTITLALYARFYKMHGVPRGGVENCFLRSETWEQFPTYHPKSDWKKDDPDELFATAP